MEINRSSCTDSKCRGLRKHPPRQRCLSETQQNLLLLNSQWHLYPEWSRKNKMFSNVLLMLFGCKFLMMHWTNCHQAEKSVRTWLNQNSILSFQMLTGIHKQDTRSNSHRILPSLLIEVHLQRVMSMFYLYLLTITTQLLEQWALLTRVPSIWFCVRYIWCSLR